MKKTLGSDEEGGGDEKKTHQKRGIQMRIRTETRVVIFLLTTLAALVVAKGLVAKVRTDPNITANRAALNELLER